MIVPEFYLQDNAEEIIHVQIMHNQEIHLVNCYSNCKSIRIIENCQCLYIFLALPTTTNSTITMLEIRHI